MKPTLIALLLLAAGAATTVHADEVSRDAAKSPPRCAPLTGSHIRQQPDANGRCPSTSSDRVRTYSADDLARQGRIDLGGSLQSLDPAVTVNGAAGTPNTAGGGRN